MHTHLHRVRVAEVDNQSYMFNSRYLEIADAALAEYLRAEGLPLPDLLRAGFDPSVVKIAAEFQMPAKLDDLIEVDTVCTRVGRSSFDLQFSFRRDETPIAAIETVYVNVDTTGDRATAIPPNVASALTRDATLRTTSNDAEQGES